MEGRLTGEEYFLDRGIIDMLVYSKKLLGENPYPTESIKFRGRYELVFLLDPFPLVDDGIRWEDEKTAREIHEEMNQEYSRFGYSPIRVPIFTASSLEEEINKRADFIINQIN
jgi:predicted ATPase